MNKKLLEAYIRNALLTEQQRIDEGILKSLGQLGLGALFMATSLFNPLSAMADTAENLAQTVAENVEGVELSPGEPGVLIIKGKPCNLGYFMINGNLDIREDQKPRLRRSYGPIFNKVLNILKQQTRQSDITQQSDINVDAFITYMTDPDEDNSDTIRILKSNLNNIVNYAHSKGLHLSDNSKNPNYFIVKKGDDPIGNIIKSDLEKTNKISKLKKQLDYMAKHK